MAQADRFGLTLTNPGCLTTLAITHSVQTYMPTRKKRGYVWRLCLSTASISRARELYFIEAHKTQHVVFD